MNKLSQKNVRLWVEDNISMFPNGFTIDTYDTLNYGAKEDILKRLLRAYNKDKFRYKSINDGLTINDLKKLDTNDIYFTKALTTKLEKATTKKIIKDAMEKDIEWSDVNTRLANNFKNWVKKYAKNFDKDYDGSLFPELPDSIKLEWLMLLAKKFGFKYQGELVDSVISISDMIKVKTLKLTQNIQDAIDETLPIVSILQTVKRSDMENWDVSKTTDFARGLKQEEIQAIRAERKVDKKRARLLGRARNINNLDAYELLLEDELFDRDMLNIIINRMGKNTAFKPTWQNNDSKNILKLIVNHPLITTSDLLRINKMKAPGWGGNTLLYSSNHLNSAMSKRADISEEELMKLIKKQQLDIKITASKKNLLPKNKEILIEYTIRHHFNKPSEMDTIFKNLSVSIDKYKKEIMREIFKSTKMKHNGKLHGIKVLKTLDNYGWIDDIDSLKKDEIIKSIILMYEKELVTKSVIIKTLESTSAKASDYMLKLYNHTKDNDFLSTTVKDVFLF